MSSTTLTPPGGLTENDFIEEAAALDPAMPAALVHAFADVECGGRCGFGPSGRPVIAYEGHVFARLTHHQYDATHPLLSYKYVRKAGPEWQANNKDQATAWATLNEAAALDHAAALQACSWGMFQVMGFNYSTCGYDNVDGFVDDMKRGPRGQLNAFVGFCKAKPDLLAAMLARDFGTIAMLYNGRDCGDYARRIERAYKNHGGT